MKSDCSDARQHLTLDVHSAVAPYDSLSDLLGVDLPVAAIHGRHDLGRAWCGMAFETSTASAIPESSERSSRRARRSLNGCLARRGRIAWQPHACRAGPHRDSTRSDIAVKRPCRPHRALAVEWRRPGTSRLHTRHWGDTEEKRACSGASGRPQNYQPRRCDELVVRMALESRLAQRRDRGDSEAMAEART